MKTRTKARVLYALAGLMAACSQIQTVTDSPEAATVLAGLKAILRRAFMDAITVLIKLAMEHLP